SVWTAGTVGCLISHYLALRLTPNANLLRRVVCVRGRHADNPGEQDLGHRHHSLLAGTKRPVRRVEKVAHARLGSPREGITTSVGNSKFGLGNSKAARQLDQVGVDRKGR